MRLIGNPRTTGLKLIETCPMEKQGEEHSMKNKLSRRQMLKVGVLGADFSLGNYLRLNAAAAEQDPGRSAILVFLRGGPSHQDTFDLKPKAPVARARSGRSCHLLLPNLRSL